MKRDRSKLPDNLPPRGLSREQAAEYIGYSVGTFDLLVKDRELPGPIPFKCGHPRWDRKKLDCWLDEMSGLRTQAERDADDLDAQFKVGRHAR